MFLSVSVISEVNWFNWDSSFKKPLSVTISFVTVKEMPSVGFQFSVFGRFEIGTFQCCPSIGFNKITSHGDDFKDFSTYLSKKDRNSTFCPMSCNNVQTYFSF